MLTLWTAFMTGLVGSLHCAGMCGPICLALPIGEERGSRLWRVLQYHFGRILVYVALGTFFGLVGAGVRLAGMQSGLSIAAGVAMLAVALLAIDVDSRLARWLPLRKVNSWVQRQFTTLLSRQERQGFYWQMGMLNGLLPCGLVYLAIAGAITLGDAGWGAMYLTAFGLGTLPLLAFTTLAGHYAGQTWRSRLRKLYPVFIGLLGVWLIYRGVHFHLPENFQFLQLIDSAPMCH
jgi:sulfite exporter TauE/SafE